MKNKKNINIGFGQVCKFAFRLVFLIVFILQLPFLADASTISLSPAKVTIHQGQSFSVSISVQGAVEASTVQMNANFTPGILRFSNWRADDSWMSLKTSDADSSNNSAGSLLKTSGFPGGFSGSKNFGTATFVGMEVGTGTITLSPNSFVYDSGNNNTFTSGNQVAVTVLPGVVKQPGTDTPNTSNTKEPVEATVPDTGIDHTFDIALELSQTNFSIGEDVTATVHITNLSSKIEDLQIPIVYEVFDVNGKVAAQSTSITQLKTLNTKFNHSIPTKDLAPGIYNIRAEIAYDDLTTPAVSQAEFNIGNTSGDGSQQSKDINIIIAVIFLLLGLLAGFLLQFAIKKFNKPPIIEEVKTKTKTKTKQPKQQ